MQQSGYPGLERAGDDPVGPNEEAAPATGPGGRVGAADPNIVVRGRRDHPGRRRDRGQRGAAAEEPGLPADVFLQGRVLLRRDVRSMVGVEYRLDAALLVLAEQLRI